MQSSWVLCVALARIANADQQALASVAVRYMKSTTTFAKQGRRTRMRCFMSIERMRARAKDIPFKIIGPLPLCLLITTFGHIRKLGQPFEKGIGESHLSERKTY